MLLYNIERYIYHQKDIYVQINENEFISTRIRRISNFLRYFDILENLPQPLITRYIKDGISWNIEFQNLLGTSKPRGILENQNKNFFGISNLRISLSIPYKGLILESPSMPSPRVGPRVSLECPILESPWNAPESGPESSWNAQSPGLQP